MGVSFIMVQGTLVDALGRGAEHHDWNPALSAVCTPRWLSGWGLSAPACQQRHAWRPSDGSTTLFMSCDDGSYVAPILELQNRDTLDRVVAEVEKRLQSLARGVGDASE